MRRKRGQGQPSLWADWHIHYVTESTLCVEYAHLPQDQAEALYRRLESSPETYLAAMFDGEGKRVASYDRKGTHP
jgi:hypothetical protein